MENLGYYNGKFGPIEDMVVPMNDRVCFFGDGVYDAGPARNFKIFAMDEHLDRFYNSARLADIQIPMPREELADLLNELVKKVDSPEHFVYYQCTRGTAPRKHDYAEGPGNLWVTITPQVMSDGTKRIKLRSEPDTRFYHCNIKTLNLIPSVMAAHKTEVAECDESVLHRGDRVTECAHSNVHIIKNGVFRTAPTDCLILPGIARANLIRMCGKLGIPVDETPFTLDDLMNADEVIVSSSGSFCLAAYEIDGKPVGGKAPELLKALQDNLVEDYLEETAE